MDNNEIQDIQEITKEAATKHLELGLKEEEFIAKTELPKNLAVIVFAAYKKGVEEYQLKYWSKDSEMTRLKTNYTNLALAIADKIAADRASNKDKSDFLPF